MSETAAGNVVRGLLHEATQRLATTEARREAELLLAHALNVSRTWLFAHAHEGVADAQAARYRELIAARANGQPIAYLTGVREFWSLPLHVTPDTLIPRAETELLVELALSHIPQSDIVDILDLGTGSGAIALALAHERPRARIVATDLSRAALGVAQANAQALRLGNIEFREGAWFAALDQPKRFDLIVANPPYIAAGDHHLGEGDLRFEPIAALASGSDGLDAIREIVANAAAHLNPGGRLLLEHGHEQGAAVRELLLRAGFVEVVTMRDLEQRERVSSGCKPA